MVSSLRESRHSKGCDTSSPVTLFLEDPNADKSAYQLRFTYEMGEAEKTGDFSMVVWGASRSACGVVALPHVLPWLVRRYRPEPHAVRLLRVHRLQLHVSDRPARRGAHRHPDPHG